MGGTALIIGGTGQVGLGTAERLLDDGWEVTLAARGRRAVPARLADHVRTVRWDREDPADDLAPLATGADLVLDCVCYTPEHAEQLLALGDRVGHLVVISTAGVYVDDEGRGMDRVDDFPRLPVPISEDQRTVEPGPGGYTSEKRAVERSLLDRAVVPVTVLRPGAIHGTDSVHSREWWFVKRVLDGRTCVPLAFGGANRFHPSAVANIAELVRLAGARPGTRVLNAVDPDAPTVLEIGRAVAELLDHEWREVPLPPDAPPPLGVTPWSLPGDVVLSMARAHEELGYRPVTSCLGSLAAEVEWVLASVADRDWREVFTDLVDKYDGIDFFDYATEDAYLAAHRF
ncbi:Nucleoside-diphosphate-sugar epimerase [Streptoalloteichus tenebrarius]|uniref:Nucleoside-diphosphate-sugar epimerase n=1 Tax=Streptoalloteichus tenebrarius (strain ATCC 17920 / DSM 40477 / JCM 4838 / CBS 697.72 / NBRC 16177 / NCIMB 11028 / NRRL B-12390 / A12253. 1 / ISP 5477) TaxID=1933 RepID=A0ABT1I0W0_STRSD|nr:NAD(P)H-binding protein [Streptoalloteichus tenebrarius]MCP2261412.1 Nucleoside-diphosphate-sugar epimerase [Streptoalloteichus tenebrarius]BFF02015.1 NAD(P)H-binding protein [Streptoalloteichus tenebrarius]